MAKKSDRAEPKKECPSCGLGVTEKAMICEFCGWDFEEEDEWILQIEKLERDLMLEKQRYEPGTVNHMIESTLRSTHVDRVAPSTPVSEEDIEPAVSPAEAEEAEPEELFEEELIPPPRKSKEERVVETAPLEPPKVRRMRSVKEPPGQPVSQRAGGKPEHIPETPPTRQRTVRQVGTEAPARTPSRQQTVEHAPTERAPEAETPVRRTRVVRKVKR